MKTTASLIALMAISFSTITLLASNKDSDDGLVSVLKSPLTQSKLANQDAAKGHDWVFSRPHIQEEAVMILADEIERLCAPQGLGIIIKAQHYCMKWRGVKEPQTSMVNSVVRGDFRHDTSLKQEFFELVRHQESMLSN